MQFQSKVVSSYHGVQWEIFGSCSIFDPSVYGKLFHTFATLVLSDGLLPPTYVCIHIIHWVQLYTLYCCFSSPFLLVYTAKPANFSYMIFQSELVSPEDRVSTPWISVQISLLTMLRKKFLPEGFLLVTPLPLSSPPSSTTQVAPHSHCTVWGLKNKLLQHPKAESLCQEHFSTQKTLLVQNPKLRLHVLELPLLIP